MQDRDSISYVGRFAPSPTGPLHFGSLVAAVASYLDARSNNGLWLLRIEDIDPPREQAGASESILHTLERYGFEWDGETIFQSASLEDHEASIASLLERGLAYPCGCSRRDLSDTPRGPLGFIYPGTCRGGTDAIETAIRARTDSSEIAFEDAVQGKVSLNLEVDSGDFVIRRRDGLIAYQLAVVVDDEIQGITRVVRGIDLIDSTPRQIWLQRILGFRTPEYAHIPVITHPNGDKLSKLSAAPAIPLDRVEEVLFDALIALNQEPPAELSSESTQSIWAWAVKNWQLGKLTGVTQFVKTP